MNVFRLLNTALLLGSLAARPAVAQTLDPSFAVPVSLYAPGAVNALGPAQADGKRLVGGFLTRANGATVSNLVRLDGLGGLDAPFSQSLGAVVGSVYRLRGLPSGQYLLCGFGGDITAGGLTRNEILRLNANGTADASFNTGAGASLGGGGNGSGYGNDYALQPDGKLLVGGSFDTFGTAPAASVVRLNPNGSVDAGFSVGTGVDAINGDAVYGVAVQPDGKIVVGGYFADFNGQVANGLARVNANGSVDAGFASPLQSSSAVENVVVQPDGKIIVSGDLYLSGATTSAGLVRLLPSGALDPAFSLAGFNSFTISLVTTSYADQGLVLQPDGKLLVAGSFRTATRAVNVVRLNANGTLDGTFQAAGGSDEAPRTLGLETNGTVLVGGAFDTFGGTENNLNRLAATGAIDAAYRPTLQLPGTVAAVVRQADGKLVAGGDFTEINGVPVHRLARFSAAGGFEAAYSAAAGVLPGRVNKLLLQPDGKLLVGNTVNTLRLSTTGSPDPGFAAPYGATALALQPDGKVLIGGNSLLRVTSTGADDPSFAQAPVAGAGGFGFTDAILVQPDGRIVTGGTYFSSSSGQSLGGTVARYETSGALDPSFNTSAVYGTSSTSVSSNNRLYALALQPDGKILVGGNFRVVGGTPRPGFARLNANGTLDAGFAPNRAQTGTVFALALQPNGRVLLGGTTSNPNPAPAYANLARVLDNGQFDASFAATANPNGPVRALLVQPDGAIVLAGSFTAVGGQPAVGLARITAPNVLAVSAPAAVAARTATWPVPAHGQLHVLPDFGARPLTIELLDALGRPLQTQPAAPATETVLDLSQRAAGVYLLRVQYAAGAVVRRVVVE